MFFEPIKSASYLTNTFKRASLYMLVSLCAMLFTVTTWAQSLENGTYTISNNVSHDNPVGEGMARSYTESTSDVEVNDNGTYVSLGFNNTQFMGEFTITVGGSNVSYETTTLANNIKKLKFKVPSLSSSIQVGLYVTAMDTKVVYTVTLNESSLKLIKKAETVPVVEENTKVQSMEDSKPASKPVKQEDSTSKKQANVEKPLSSAPTKVEGVAKSDSIKTQAAKAEVIQEDTMQEKRSETKEAAEANAEDSAKGSVKVEEKAEIKEKVEEAVQTGAQEEVGVEVKEDTSNTQAYEAQEVTASEDNEVAALNNNLSKTLIICGIALAAVIGIEIYLKRK